MKLLTTRAASFIGQYFAMRLLARRDAFIHSNSPNDDFSVLLRDARLAKRTLQEQLAFVKTNIADSKMAIVSAATDRHNLAMPLVRLPGQFKPEGVVIVVKSALDRTVFPTLGFSLGRS